jgi:MFS family permease
MPAERSRGREATEGKGREAAGGRYKWVALSNTTLGMLVATINSSIVIISLPAIFRGIGLDPLRPGNVSYLLWMLMGYLVVSAVLVVAFGRLGDIYGRVRMYNAGFLIFTLASIALAFTPDVGSAGALELIGLRIVQGVGGALLMANSMAILTDAFPVTERGMALGINQVAALAGSFMGLLIGGLLADTNWRAVFLVSVPFGIFGTVWGYLKLREMGQRGQGRIDWAGNLTFAVGLIAVLVGITYGIQPYGGHTMGWTSPLVVTLLVGGAALLGVFLLVERRSADPLFHLDLFRIRAFSAGNLAGLLASVSRGGLQFMLIIWLQGIWLPLHGYSFASTPLWAGIYMIPLTLGFLVAGPVSGWLSDHHGARPFATGGMLLTAASFAALMLLPIDFPYLVFAALLLLNGIGSGLFAAPNTAGIMNAVPARQRGAASGMRATFQNAGFVLSIGLFFSLMVAGLAARLPTTLYAGLTANGVPPAAAERIANLPPVGSLFAAFLGYNPIRTLLGPAALERLSPAQAANLTGTSFFPRLIAEPFKHGLAIVFLAALAMSLVAAAASWLRGGRYVHEELEAPGAAGMTGRLRIGEAAERAAVSVRTLRYYEELGLLTPSAHSPGGARRYAEEDLARLARIRELKDLLGFNLDEVRTVLTAEDRLGSLRAAYHAEDDRAAQRAIVAEALEINSRLQAAVQAKLERLATFKGELEAKADRYSASLAGLQPPSDAGVPG